MSWITDVFDNSLIINSKVSFSRNIKEVQFINKLVDDDGKKIVNDIENIFYNNNEFFKGFTTIKLWESENELARLACEKFLVDYEIIKNNSMSAFFINKDEDIVIMVNGKNHVKIECTSNTLNLEKIFDKLNQIDDLFEKNLRYAFDEKLGYLSNNLTNLGLGLEVSVTLHLPALAFSKKIKSLVNEICKIGINIESVFSEGLEESNIYKIYNSTSMGVSEKSIISKLKTVVEQIIVKEEVERGELLNNMKFEIFDNIFKSFGLLKNSYIISQKESFKLLSSVRMGVEMSIINDIDKKILNKLLVNIQLSSLKNRFKINDFIKNGDVERAQYIRQVMSNSL